MIAKRKKIDLQRIYYAVTSVVIIVVIWEFFAGYYARTYENGEYLFPSIISIFKKSLLDLSAFFGMGGLGAGQYGLKASYGLSMKVIGYHTGKTLVRLVGGFSIGILLGIAMGILYKANKYYRAFTSIPSKIISIIPQMALITLFLAWFGDSEIGYMAFIAFGVFVAVYINTINAIENLPSIYYKYAKTLGAGGARYYITVVLPAIIPELTGCLKMIVGQAWALSMASEFISSQNGLGRLIVLARQRMDTGIILIVLFLYIIYTLITLQVLYWLCNRITRWMPKIDSKPVFSGKHRSDIPEETVS